MAVPAPGHKDLLRRLAGTLSLPFLLGGLPSGEMLMPRQALVIFAVTYVAYGAMYFARKPFAVVKGTLEGEVGAHLDSQSSLHVVL